jgi:uncharacterized protein
VDALSGHYVNQMYYLFSLQHLAIFAALIAVLFGGFRRGLVFTPRERLRHNHCRFEWRASMESSITGLKAREFGLRGATVLRGPLGYGRSSRIHKCKIIHLSEDLPVVVEIIDTAEKIEAFLPVLDAMMVSGLVTLEKARILTYAKLAHDRPV